MSLFDDQAGVAGAAFSDLFTISGSDLGLGEDPVASDPTVQQVTYAETAGQPATADRLNNLVNGTGTPSVPATPPIVITALNGGNDPHSGLDVTGNGFTYMDNTGTSPVIRAVYDVSDCNGQGIQVFDAGGNLIAEPRAVIIYHELSHAFHFAIGQIPFPQTACPGNTTDEPAAEIDENVLRAQLGLPLRDPCNHGGQCGGGPSNSCFTGDTRVTLADGEEKSIEGVRTGDLVLGRSGRANRVIGIERPLLGDRKLFAFNGGAPFVTAEHPIMTTAGWKAIDPEATAAENPFLVVGRLMLNDVLVILKECAVAVGAAESAEIVEPVLESISLIRLEESHADPGMPVYNLLLDGDHTYFANGLLVHNKCFIVSATTGSPVSEEVIRLRQLRERVAATSDLSARLIDAIYREYFQFSPGIAVELDQDAVARKAVLWIVVRPLLAWYSLACILALERDESAVKNALRDISSACPRYLGASSIATLLETIRAGEPLPTDAPQLLLDFAPRIQEAARLRFASWGILDPLVRAWGSTARSRDVVDEVAQWLATAPLEALPTQGDSDLLAQDVAGLASFFDFRPTARLQLGARLAAAWPSAADALERHGFIQQREVGDE
jgi:hypothetical protein